MFAIAKVMRVLAGHATPVWAVPLTLEWVVLPTRASVGPAIRELGGQDTQVSADQLTLGLAAQSMTALAETRTQEWAVPLTRASVGRAMPGLVVRATQELEVGKIARVSASRARTILVQQAMPTVLRIGAY